MPPLFLRCLVLSGLQSNGKVPVRFWIWWGPQMLMSFPDVDITFVAIVLK
jgi:hypothetical protein